MSTQNTFEFNTTTMNVDDNESSPDVLIGIDLGKTSFWNRTKLAYQLMTKGFHLSVPFNFKKRKELDRFINSMKKRTNYIQVSNFKVQKVMDNAYLPTKAHPNDTGWDLYCPYDVTIQPQRTFLVDFGIRIAIEPGYEIQVRNRSGMVSKWNVMMALGVGSIDQDYRGSIMCPMYNFGESPVQLRRGSRLAQLVIKKTENVKLIEGKVGIDTERGENGFGSTDL